ncbi:MAG TPA: hypothetical protein GXX18_06045 [Bacillales bacterium]|nr:hypothetical protein [Bacillales bacterium]
MYKKIMFIKPFSFGQDFQKEEGEYFESDQLDALQGFVDDGYAIFV